MIDIADLRTINPVHRGSFLADAMARVLNLHRAAKVWDSSYSHALTILAAAGFTAAEVIEYAAEAVNAAKGTT